MITMIQQSFTVNSLAFNHSEVINKNQKTLFACQKVND